MSTIVRFREYEIEDEKARQNIEELKNSENKLKFPFKLGGFIAILDDKTTGNLKSDENIKEVIQNSAKAGIKLVNLEVEIMPSLEQKQQFANGTITTNDIVLNSYPSVEMINTYFEYAKSFGIELSVLKFHCLWANENVNKIDQNVFINKYKQVVLSSLSQITIKPRYVTVLNESYSLINENTKSNIISLLRDIKTSGYKTGLCGIPAKQIINLNLGNEIDGLFPHFYPYATMKGEKATLKDVYEGIEKSLSGEKEILYFKSHYPDKPVIIAEVGASSYWESLATPENWWGGTANAHYDSNGMPIALYLKAALKYYSQFQPDEIYNFWGGTDLKYVKEFLLDYYERGVITYDF